MLGEAGATVYCTGRSVRGAPHPTGPYAGRPESIEETAERVTAAGGEGIALRVDFEVEDEVRSLFERVRRERGRLDVLVNAMSGNALTSWDPFWKSSCSEGRAFFDSWVWKHFCACRYAAAIMVEQKSGLIVEVTEGDTLSVTPQLYWDLVKTTLARSVLVMAEQLAEYGVSAIALTPGYLRSEYALDHHGVTETNWRDAAARDRYFLHSETPCFIGRAVAALAADPNVHAANPAACLGRGHSPMSTASPTSMEHVRTGVARSGPKLPRLTIRQTNVEWQINSQLHNGDAQ